MNTLPSIDFHGRVAIVTGAGQGIGRDYAISLASRGARVVVNDVSEERGTQVVSEIQDAGGSAVRDTHDVSLSAPAIVDAAIRDFGQIDILINNAGIFRGGLFEEQDPDVFWNEFNVSFRGSVELTRAAWPSLKKSGSGRLIFIASSGVFGGVGQSAYGAAKGAVWALGNNLSQEGQAHGIQVSTIMPTAWTPMTEGFWSGYPRIGQAFKEHMSPKHVAAFVTYLAHQDCEIGGSSYAVSGGNISRLTYSSSSPISNPLGTPEGWGEVAPVFEHDSRELQPFNTTVDHIFHELLQVDESLQDAINTVKM